MFISHSALKPKKTIVSQSSELSITGDNKQCPKRGKNPPQFFLLLKLMISPYSQHTHAMLFQASAKLFPCHFHLVSKLDLSYINVGVQSLLVKSTWALIITAFERIFQFQNQAKQWMEMEGQVYQTEGTSFLSLSHKLNQTWNFFSFEFSLPRKLW